VALALAGSATVAVGLTKWLMHAGRSASLDAQLRDEAFAMELSSRSEDFREGVAAFAQKRLPVFTGR
jgi:2-(1,2-epoxy-1,2-dihydrophenyl)acetyl-CoA isomerase